MRWMKRLTGTGKRWIAGGLAVVMAISGIGVPMPSLGSEIWPQKSTAPFYCLDGGKGWKSTDRYEIYRYDTMPSALTETQAKRLFWAYPSNWNALKEAAAKYDTELYNAIKSTVSGPNVVKRVKDDANTMFAWVADHPEIEARAIAVLERSAAENASQGKEAPEAIREATSEEKAVSFTVLPFSAGPGALDTEFKLGTAFIKDIAKIEAQSVWDNGSDGGNVGWLDASQDKNIAKSVLGDSLYEITWSGDSIKIRNNGSVTANENAVGSTMTEEQKYNKTTVRYKITMREDSGWYTEGSWNENYLQEWMDFKACVNAPGQQRLYKADIRIVPSDMVFYLVVGQGGSDETFPAPEYGSTSAGYNFQIYRHEEEFEANYNVKLKKVDDETGMALKGSQFYLYERFEDADVLTDEEENGGLTTEQLNFVPWDGFQVFAEGTTDADGEIRHTDTRSYVYSKTYCDGHSMPDWVSVPDEEEDSEEEDSDSAGSDSGAEEAKDQNRAAARQWMELFEACEQAGNEDGTHFHWLVDESVYDTVRTVMESGEPDGDGGSLGADAETAFEKSGCKDDCEETYEKFINLKFSYTWKEIQARNGYILHDVHEDDVPIEVITTVSSEAGADAVIAGGSSREIAENIWYGGNHTEAQRMLLDRASEETEETKALIWDYEGVSASDVMSGSDAMDGAAESVWSLQVMRLNVECSATDSNATDSNATDSNAENGDAPSGNAAVSGLLRVIQRLAAYADEESDDSEWETSGSSDDFSSYLEAAKADGIQHLPEKESGKYSYASQSGSGRDYWIVRDHRTEGQIHINKRDMDLYVGESDEYSAFGDTEGDGVLEGAVYGLFAAENILHPDSDLASDGTMTNTGIVYQKNDLVSVAETDFDGNAEFLTYTVAPGITYDYEAGEIVKREGNWIGPKNLYEENFEEYGNWWIGRTLILGSYYVKELSRGEGYELSVNGKSGEWTNYDAATETPGSITESHGMAVVSVPEWSASMESEDESGNGYDRFTFSVTSSGTTNGEQDSDGHEILVSGLPEDTKFYRVDSGEKEVTGPHVTGTEEVILRDENGAVIWKTADSDTSHVRYEPEYDENGEIIGQTPVSRIEPQTLTAWQVPQVTGRSLEKLETELEDDILNEPFTEENFGVLKAELERILNRNGYEVPVTWDGNCSQPDAPVYSMGVKKGEEDSYGMTTDPGEAAVKTVYGAALKTLLVPDANSDTTVQELLGTILAWYQDNPQWSFGGLHDVVWTEDGCEVILYAGASVSGSRRFFTMKQENGKLVVDRVYAVIENPYTLRWEYQEYDQEGIYQYQVLQQYCFGSGTEKRYYIDVVLMPAVLINADGVREIIEHTVMVHHKKGEAIIDYLIGDPENGYKVPETEEVDKIEITTEMEYAEEDVRLQTVTYDRTTGIHRIQVRSNGTDAFGKNFSDEAQSLTLSFMAVLPEKKAVITDEDLRQMGAGNVYGYQSGDEIGYAEYLAKFQGASVSVTTGNGKELEDTYIAAKQLLYRGQYRVTEDGDTTKIPVQVLQRPIKQKIKVVKETEGGQAVGNFRFKVYLKSNLERLYCEDDGTITWLDKYGNPVDIGTYKENFPELVQKIYTRETGRQVVEDENYEKFFDAMQTANTDRWKNEGKVWNTSWKPFVENLFTHIENERNTSPEAKENAKRSDAVRQFAVTWYLEEELEKDMECIDETSGEYLASAGSVTYQDEVYDKALCRAIQRAEEYLAPFFRYDLDAIYAVLWDSEEDGGIDGDLSTLAADQMSEPSGESAYAFGISKYLPYGKYMMVEQQPYKAEWMDFENRHYKIDTPKEIALPQYYEEGELVPYPEVDWSVTEPGTKADMVGYACQEIYNDRYRAKLRIEKLDAETGEPILHEDAVFALYRAERNEEKDGDGAVKWYETDTVIAGSREFLEAMGARNITPFARSVGNKYFGLVEAGTPICQEEDAVLFEDENGIVTGQVIGLSTVKDEGDAEIFQTTGYLETPEPVPAGVYVLAELKVPAGYVRSKPMPVEIYSDSVMYYPDGGSEKAAAVKFDVHNTDTARIYVNDTATALEVSKLKTEDRSRGMKVSGRVEGTISGLSMIYGLENLELAYNSMGTYLGFGWKKGTLEMLEHRKLQGERVELVYENGIFQGYGYVMRTLETSDDENRYVAGAVMALYDAIEIRKNGDSEDYGFEGVNVSRDRNGNVTDITVEKGYAGEKAELVLSEDGIWKAETIEREDTSVLFYDLGNLKVLEYGENGSMYGYDKSGQKMKITSDTDSVFAIRGGRAEFEIVSEDFSAVVYDKQTRAFTELGEDTLIYHLDEDLCRDALVDGYTGLAYVERTGRNALGQAEPHFFVWPVVEIRDSEGMLVSREKILTGRPGERDAGTSQAYITGTWNEEQESFEKIMNPVYDRFGMVQYYLPNESTYIKGREQYDRDGDKLGYRYEDLLEMYNRAAYRILDHEELYEVEETSPLKRRLGESWIIPNIWVSGEETPQDPGDAEMSLGQADLLRRVVPGTYIMEEIAAPQGYVRGLPTAVCVEETAEVQRVSMTDEKIKVEILKVDGTEQYKKQILTEDEDSETEWYTEGKGAYTGDMVKGAKLALYKAKRVYVSDYERYPKGYYLVKEESTPATWTAENPVDNSPVTVKALWITDGTPKYFEGIPAGDYILEELETPSGYLSESMEITVKETKELQSFFMLDDHTKVEIFKYEKDRNGNQMLLERPYSAELTLYPAVLDANGEVLVKEGELQYEEENPVDTWIAADFSPENEKIMNAYEEMFKQYGAAFDKFSWESPEEGVTRMSPAVLVDSHSTGNGETVTQIWKLEDGSMVRITAEKNSGTARLDTDGRPEIVFEYQFQYKECSSLTAPNMVSYDTENGIHRMDRLPLGVYVLVETKTPDGYETAEPKVIKVGETDAVQRFALENKKVSEEVETGELRIKKTATGDPEKILSGAWFEVKNLYTGECYRMGTDETGYVTFKNLPIEGPDLDGKWRSYVYQVREITAPPGYCLNNTVRYLHFDREDGNELVCEITVENRETSVCIRKTDLTTGEELPGAKLTLKQKDGTVIDQWISEMEPHWINGILIAEETYVLSEESAPDGYLVAEDVEFTVSLDGTVDKVVMEDERKPEEPKEPEEPDEPETPAPEQPDEPQKPTESYEPERESPIEPEVVPNEPEPVKTYGRITANYHVPFTANGVVYLDETGKLVLAKAPNTGEEWPTELVGSCLVITFIGIMLLFLVWTEKKEGRTKEDR